MNKVIRKVLFSFVAIITTFSFMVPLAYLITHGEIVI